MRKIFSVLMLSLVMLSSCKKNNEAKIEGTWDIETITTKYYEDGALVDTDVENGNGATMTFNSNGEVEITTPFGSQTFDYSVDGDEITMNGETAEIQELTSSRLVIYAKEVWGAAGDYDETIMVMTK